MADETSGNMDMPETMWVGSLPSRIGPYLIRRKLGEGGMGVVYEAEQKQPQRRVALKVVRATALTGSARRRFDLEVAVLGRLEHPGIARIYDAGVAPVGGVEQPYFAMELIDGLPIQRHVQVERLSLPRCLELMARVCDAVQYAHQKGVIHRDLKPANILVPLDQTATSDTADPGAQPKVLDFGVARATDADSQLTTQHTRAGDIVGTLQYMSPEQIAGDAFEVDARSDVYSLGVILFELLSGRLPHEDARISPLELARAVRDEPILARPAEAELLAVAARDGFAAAHDRDHPDALSAINNLALVHVERGEYAQAEVLLRQCLETSERVHGADSEQTLNYVANLASVVSSQARKEEAEVLVRRALAGRAASLGERHPATLGSRNSLAMLYSELGRLAAAESVLVALVPVAREVLGEEHPTVAIYTNNLAALLSSAGRHEEALPLVRQVYDANRRVRGPRHPDTLEAAPTLAGALEGLQRFAPAESLYLEVLAGRRELLGDSHPQTIGAVNNLGFLYRNQRRFADAEPLFREAWQGFRVALGEKHPSTLTTASNLGNLYNAMGRYAEAEPINAEVLAGLREVLPADHWLLGTVMVREGSSLRGLGQYAQAEPLLLQGYGLLSEALGADSERTRLAVGELATLYERWGRAEEALAWRAREGAADQVMAAQ